MLAVDQHSTSVVTQRGGQPWRADRVIRGRARQLRRDMNKPERLLWSILRDGQMDGYRFRRQHPIGDFIVDFFCPAARLAVEVDGDTHAEQEEYDRRRTRWLATQKGVRVLRVSNLDVLANLEGVYDLILEQLRAGPLPDPPRSQRCSRGGDP
jgi:very-short-patch-repair endonuclease